MNNTFDIKENLKKLPASPGVYMHKDKLGEVIYVGKAVSLRNRIRQYFQSYGQSTPKLRALVKSIEEFEYIICESEMESLILENNLIKKYMPKYNVLLRDDKTYPYIALTLVEEYPRLIKTRLLRKDGSKYFGPYSDAGAVNTVVELLNHRYSLKRCTAKSFPKGFRPCLNYRIGECVGVCTEQVCKDEYSKRVKAIADIISGRNKSFLKELAEDMKKLASEMRFEEAAQIRDGIEAFKALMESQRVTMTGDKDIDVVLPLRTNKIAKVIVFMVRDGKLVGRDMFDIQVDSSDDDEYMVGEFIKQYYSKWVSLPHEILLEKLPTESELIERLLSSESSYVKLKVPKRGKKRGIIDLAQKNRDELKLSLISREEREAEKRRELNSKIAEIIQTANSKVPNSGFIKAAKDLNSDANDGGEIPKGDYRIEAYDISNTNGIDSVGAMVVFEGKNKLKQYYRRFKIKTIDGADDYGSLKEMVYRRFSRADKGDPAFMALPDCIFVDGGLGQVRAVIDVLRAMEKDIAVVGLAKDNAHRTRAIVFEDGEELELKTIPLLFKYAGTVQEEVHRFAIDYHKKLRNKDAIRSVLDSIEGIGEKRKNALLLKFGGVEEIKNASIEELSSLPEMNERAAKSIKKFFGC